MLDNNYIHTFSTMSSLKSSKTKTYSKKKHSGMRYQSKPLHGFTDENEKQISPMLRKPSKKINAFDITQR